MQKYINNKKWAVANLKFQSKVKNK